MNSVDQPHLCAEASKIGFREIQRLPQYRTLGHQAASLEVAAHLLDQPEKEDGLAWSLWHSPRCSAYCSQGGIHQQRSPPRLTQN